MKQLDFLTFQYQVDNIPKTFLGFSQGFIHFYQLW